ncbi:MAG: hypothetical protein ACE5JO_06055 [Candidatus Binatia bacterium]
MSSEEAIKIVSGTFADMAEFLGSLLENLWTPSTSSIFQVGATITATALVLFLTLILIPIQQVASRYSPVLLTYFKRDKVAILLTFVLLVSLFFNIFMLLIQPMALHAAASAVLVFVSFICIVFTLLRIIKMLNPSEYLLPKLKNDCIGTLKSELPKQPRLSPEEQLHEIQDRIQQVMLVGERAEPGEEKWAIHEVVNQRLMERMMPLKGIIMNLTSSADYEVFSKAVTTLREIAVGYLGERKEYKSFHDPFIVSLCETLKDLLRTAERNENVLFTRVLLEAVRDIARGTLEVRVLGSNSGHNNLAQGLWLVLRERAERAIRAADCDRSFDAVSNLGSIGEALAAHGMGHSAAEVAYELAELGRLCHATNNRIAIVPIRQSIADIFFYLLFHRKLYANYDYPYSRLVEVYEAMLDIPVDPATALSIGDPMFGLNIGVTRDRSVSALARAAIFSPYNGDQEILHNMSAIKGIVGLLQREHDKDHVTGMFFSNHLYHIGLWLLAFIDREITLEMTFLPAVTVPTEENVARAKEVLIDILDYNLEMLIDVINRRRMNINQVKLLGVCFSLFYLVLHLDHVHALGLREAVKEILDELPSKLNSLRHDMDEATCENVLKFSDYLERIGFETLAQGIRESAEQKTVSEGSALARHGLRGLVDYIERPGFPFNADLFHQFDTEIFGSGPPR